jgi:hypothetical protein
MNEALKEIILLLMNKKIWGHKHIPERLIIMPRIKHMRSDERKDFEDEYYSLINKGYFIRLKKRTGKGSDWHMSLNSHKSEELNEYVGEE